MQILIYNEKSVNQYVYEKVGFSPVKQMLVYTQAI